MNDTGSKRYALLVTNADAAAGGDAVSIADGSDVTQGTKADTPATVADATPFSVISLLKGIFKQFLNGVGLGAAVVPAATTMQNAAGTGNPDGTTLNVQGYATAIVQVVSGTPMSGGTTINFEVSADGTTWVPIIAHKIGAAGVLATTTTADGDFRFNVAGFKSLRARISAWSAGVTTVKGYPTPLSAQPTAINTSESAATIPTFTTLQSAVVASGNGTTLDIQGQATAVVQVTGMSGGVTVVNFEVSEDDTNWSSISSIQSGFVVSTTTIDGSFRFHVSGWKSLRARVSAYSAGTITVKGYVSPLVAPLIVSQVTQSAATMPTATTMQNAAGTGNPNGTSINVQGYATAIINVVSGTPMSGGTTVNFEASVDDVTWVAILAHQVGLPGAMASTTTIDGDFRLNVAGYKSVRARISAWSAGITTIKGYTTPLSAQATTETVVGSAASGATDSGNPVKVGGKYNSPAITLTNGQRGDLQLDASGYLLMSLATALYGEDNVNNVMATETLPLTVSTYAWSVGQSSALEASHVIKNGAGNLRSLNIRLDGAAGSATYYIQILDAASVPGDGAVTHLFPPVKKIHVSGTDDNFTLDFTQNCIHATTGIVIVLSSTEFTKTISGVAGLSIGALYK